MSGNPYEAPKSNLAVQAAPQFSPVKKPWTRWIVGLLALLTFGLFSSGLSGPITEYVGGDEALRQVIGSILLMGTLALVYGMITLNKPLSLATAFLFLLIGLYQLLRFGVMLVDGADLRSLVLVFLLYIATPFLCVWYILRPAYRETINTNKRYNEAVSMQKHVARQLRKR